MIFPAYFFFRPAYFFFRLAYFFFRLARKIFPLARRKKKLASYAVAGATDNKPKPKPLARPMPDSMAA